MVSSLPLHGPQLGEGCLQKIKTADLVTSSQSVGVGQDENTISGASEIVTYLLCVRGLKYNCHFLNGY